MVFVGEAFVDQDLLNSTISVKNEQLIFLYQTLPFTPKKELALSDINPWYLVESPLYPVLDEQENGWGNTWLIFSSRYQILGAQLAQALGCKPGTNSVLKGLQAALGCSKKQLSKPSAPKASQTS